MRAEHPKARPLAVVCSDIHLSHTPPVFRAMEPDWYAAMARPLVELQCIVKELKPPAMDDELRSFPILCCGDVFDRHNPPPSLINFALRYMPNLWAIPGQHDLPYHGLNLIQDCAFWTLVQSGKIQVSATGVGFGDYRGIEVYSYPFGFDSVRTPSLKAAFDVAVAIVHAYTHETGDVSRMGSSGFAGPQASASARRVQFDGYDVVFIGDNHKHFIECRVKPVICNVGTMMRRKSDELAYEPSVCVLFSDGGIERYKLDTSQDIYDHSIKTAVSNPVLDFEALLNELKDMQTTGIDFRETMERTIADKPKGIREVILKAMEQA